MPNVIDLSQWNDLMERLTRFAGSAMPSVMRFVGGRVGAKAEELSGAVPPPSRKPLPKYYTRQAPDGATYKSKFKSIAQQRKVMALAAEGKIPHKRSGQLARSITSNVTEATATGARVAVGTNYKGAQYVIGKATQSRYHAGTWTPLEDRLFAGQSQLVKAAGDALFVQAEKYAGGR